MASGAAAIRPSSDRGFQPLSDDVQRGSFFAHDRDALPSAQRVGDEVDDDLAFACTRRTIDDEMPRRPGNT